MVIQISNKTSSSSSTCVLVRMVMKGDPSSRCRDGCNPELFIISFSCVPGPTVLLLSRPCTCYVLLWHQGEPAS